MKSMVGLSLVVLQECGELVGISTTRDEEYLRSRVGAEGLSFLTITLPSIDKALLNALDRGRWEHNSLLRLKSQPGTERPRFLGAFIALIFGPCGALRTDNREQHPVVIRLLRQFLLLHSKVELPCTEQRVKEAIQGYVETDKTVPIGDRPELHYLADRLFGRQLSMVESALFKGDLPGRFSSGSLATRERYNSRYATRCYTERLNAVLPHWDYYDVSPRHTYDEEITMVDRDGEIPCRVTTVPKTMKTPRIIAMEPVWNNYIQQTILQGLEQFIARDPALRAMNWFDQTRNRSLAKEGSITGAFCTIDLSEASDRVSASLVVDVLLGRHKFLRKAVLACRSERAELPDGTVVTLKKFASMGSALTFPFESMVFYLLVCHVFLEVRGHLPCYATRCALPCQASVYGDDIIVPADMMSSVTSTLEAYGLKVNSAKSFGTGMFRESCGADWYDGGPVSPVRCRAQLPGSTHRDPELVSRGMELQNRLFLAGFYRSASFVGNLVKEARRDVPYSLEPVDGLTLLTEDERLIRYRMNPNLQRLEVRCWLRKELYPIDSLDGWGALWKYFTARGPEPLRSGHLDRDGRTHCVNLISAWTRVG